MTLVNAEGRPVKEGIKITMEQLAGLVLVHGEAIGGMIAHIKLLMNDIKKLQEEMENLKQIYLLESLDKQITKTND